ncbi:MAG TPA: acyl carrier protein [Polyangiales bacterium]|nr:acyl carrier protein [Polyangiales bacterium]
MELSLRTSGVTTHLSGVNDAGPLDWCRCARFDGRVATTLNVLLELCARRFGKSASELGADDDVFQSLGVDSMQVLSLLSELEQHFNVEIPDYELREVRSFSQLAECIERRL